MNKYRCSTCNWIFDPSTGDPKGNVSPGTDFKDFPDAWCCPICAASKKQFILEKADEEDVSETSASYLEQFERLDDPIEPELRSIFFKAVSGNTEFSSMRTFKQKKSFEKILFSPGQLQKKPLREDEVDVDLKTTIGPGAKKPLIIDLPYFVSHMSYGALSKEAKVALAKGAAKVKIAASSGEGGMLNEERQAAYKYIFEYSTGRFGATEQVMRQADAIEIKIGQSAKAGLGGHLPAKKVTEEIAKVRNIKPNTSVISPANHSDINSKEDLKEKIEWLRKITDGVPIGIKLVAGNIEGDLEIALFSDPDFITVDCRGGSTGTAPTHVKDNMSFPAPYAIKRVRAYLDQHKQHNVTFVVTGGIRTSADIAKCLAMGADVVALATVSMIGIGCQQYRVCHKGKCPVGVATQEEELRKRFDIEKSADMLSNLFCVYKEELEDFIRIVGKKSARELDTSDLITICDDLSKHANIRHC